MTYPWHQQLQEKLSEARQSERLPHALLFNAESGCGHEAFVMQLAQSLLCLQSDNTGTACGQCRSCGVFQAQAHPDFMQINVPEDKKIIGVEQIRTLNQFLELSRSYSPVRVAIISLAEAMNVNAANSLLKTLEEPAANTHILLFSLQAGSLLPTIRSRCQQIRQPLPAPDEALLWLEGQQLPVNEHEQFAASLLALAGGKPLDALELADGELNARYERWAQQLLDLLSRNRALADISTEWSKQDRSDLLDWQISLLQALLREQYVETPASSAKPSGENSTALYRLIKNKNLWGLHDALLQLKTLATHPLNPQLFAENMLSLWLKL